MINMAVLFGVVVLTVFLVYRLFVDPAGRVRTDVLDLTTAVEQIQELSTVKSHFRFAVVVREEAGNIIVRRLADQITESQNREIAEMDALIRELEGR